MQSESVGRTPPPLAPWFPRGVTLLQNPELNKGTAFSAAERDALGLKGLLPPHVCSQVEQVSRVLGNFRRLDNPLEKYIFLTSLHDRNEALFFRILMEHPDEMLPIIYTPTVGLACQKFGHIFQRPRGIFVTAEDRGQVAGAPSQLAASGCGDDRRHRRRAHPRPRRPGIQWHGNSGRQALALHRLRRHPPDSMPAGDARRGHQQSDAARRPALPRPGPAASHRGGLRRAGGGVRQRGRGGLSGGGGAVRGLRQPTTPFAS